MRSFGLEIEGFGDLAIEVEDELSLPRLRQTKGLAGYEPATTAVFIEALWHGPEGAVVDVGANFGKRRGHAGEDDVGSGADPDRRQAGPNETVSGASTPGPAVTFREETGRLRIAADGRECADSDGRQHPTQRETRRIVPADLPKSTQQFDGRAFRSRSEQGPSPVSVRGYLDAVALAHVFDEVSVLRQLGKPVVTILNALGSRAGSGTREP
jgi:hypothetical protein